MIVGGRDRQRIFLSRAKESTAVVIIMAAVSCGVGEGTGRVVGNLAVTQCRFDPPRGLTATEPYDLRVDFFVGQPIDADRSAPGFPQNQMVIRLQHSGARVEDADVLLLWVADSAAVARCIRGASPGGVPEWDPVFCDRSAASLGPNGEGRMLVGMTSEIVSASFALSASCPGALVSANALGRCDDGSCPDVTLCPGRGSWITFTHFGNVSMDTSRPIGAGFRVNDHERISARLDPAGQTPSFHLELCDRGTVISKLRNILPIPKPNIVGTLEGFFDFKLERGQAGQPFP